MKTSFLKKPALRTSLCVLALLAQFSCQESPFEPKADFTYEMDPNVPGKVHFKNQSQRADQYFWQFGYRQSNGVNAYSPGHSSDKASPVYYFVANGEAAVSLTATGGPSEDEITKHIPITNVPAEVTVKNIVIRRLGARKADDTSYDPEDGTAPDLFFDACADICGSAQYITPDYSKMYVNMAGFSLPYTHELDPNEFHYTGLSPQTRDFVFYVYDFDYYGFGMGTAEIVSVLAFNPYRRTALYNKGQDDNYPSKITVDDETIEADIYLEWR
jgi:PKD repeat protein